MVQLARAKQPTHKPKAYFGESCLVRSGPQLICANQWQKMGESKGESRSGQAGTSADDKG